MVTDILTLKSRDDLERALRERRDLAPVNGIPITTDELARLTAAIDRGMPSAPAKYKMQVLQAAVDWYANAKLQRGILGIFETKPETAMITGMREHKILFDFLRDAKPEGPPMNDQEVTSNGR